MELRDMRKELANLVDDRSFGPEELDLAINKAVQYVAMQADLPSLKRVGSVTLTADAYSASVATISGSELVGRISMATIGSLKKVLNIMPNVEEMLEKYPGMDVEGTPVDIVLEHTTLWWQPMSSAAYTATVVFYTKPAQLSKDGDEPSDFPEHLHRALFVNGAAWMIYDEIEDGIELKEKVNTKSQFWLSFDETNRHSGIIKLKEFLAKNRVHHISSIWRY